MTTHTLVLIVLVALSWLAPSSSSAQASATASSDGAELETEARARFALGQLYYSQARFAEAATEFEAAYALHAHPLLLHNIYLSRRDMGDFPAALAALTRYLERATDLSASDRRVLEGRQAAMQRQLASATTTTTTTTTPEPPLDPVVGGAASLAPGEVPADPEQAPQPEPPPSSGDDGVMTGAIVAFSVAGAAALTMVITGPLALTERDHLATTCAPACSDDQISSAQTLGAVTDVALTIGLVAAATGAVLAIVAGTSTSGVSVTPTVSPDHAAIVVGGQF